MSKIILKKELVLIDFKKNAFKFYNVEVISLGYNDIQVIYTSGKLGNKGKTTMNRFIDFNEARKNAYKKIYDKKGEGFINKEHMIGWLGQSEDNHKKNEKNVQRKYKCSECKNDIKKVNYFKINEWARGEGNWDYDRKSPGYKKVLCIDCQFKHNIFRKRLGNK